MALAEIIWGFITLMLVADMRRISQRLRSLEVLKPSDMPFDERLVWVSAPGISVPSSTASAAMNHMTEQNLEALELVPQRLSLSTLWSLAYHLDPETLRHHPQRQGESAMHAFVAPREVLEEMAAELPVKDLATFVSLSREVRRRVGGRHDFAIARELEAHAFNPFFEASALEVVVGGSIRPVLLGIPVATLVLALGVMLAPVTGSLALAAYVVQQPLGVRRSGFTLSHPWLQGLVRLPVDIAQWLRLIRSTKSGLAKINELRPVYRELLADGTDVFFEVPMTACPSCSSPDFGRSFSVVDHHQNKPGRFTMTQCRACRAWFQNPRLNQRGLEFYYRDCYDGLGEHSMDTIFEFARELYEGRYEMLTAHHRPARWLDVGCGHGHMFAYVRSMHCDATLVGLDMGEAVEVGRARGWMDETHRGFFPDVAGTTSDRFDVVSMCHYLEHVTDISVELKAAHTVLSDGGVLLIEVPDPDSVFAKLLGRWWMPWVQPQHLVMVPTVEMARLLRNAGFEPIEWQTSKAHSPNDLFLSAIKMVRAVAPILHAPWLPEPPLWRRLVHNAVWVIGVPFIGVASLLDQVVAPLARRAHHTSQYRVLARKR